jgi:hypothetical protein
MADSTIDSEKIVLIDNWPGVALPVFSEPTDGFTGATTERAGTKIQVWNDGDAAGVSGWSTFIALNFEGTGAPTSAAKQVCVQDASGDPYTVTNDPDSCVVATGASAAAVSLQAMTDATRYWFWCGGVCPESYVAALGGTYNTEGNVIAGPIVAHDLAADEIGFGPCGGATECIIGYADGADT